MEHGVDLINAAMTWLVGLVGLDWQVVPVLVRTFFGMAVACAVLIAYIAVLTIFFVWAERRVSGRIQSRQGPNRVGPLGLLQCVADGIKLLIKEDVIPGTVHPFLFRMAPILVFMGALAPFVVLPFSERLVISHMALGVYYALSFAALEVIGVIMAGWSSNNKWSLFGGMRLAAQMMSYEIPMGLAVLTIVVLTGSLQLSEIVRAQEGAWIFGWNIFRGFPWAFLAAFIFYMAGLASSKRTPFDLPEAESELVAGFHTEYSGMRFAIFFLSEYATMYVICVLATVLFLGGWHGPIPRPSGAVLHELVGVANLIMKAYFLMFVMLWLRWTFPRVRVDQIITICMKVLVPVGMACLVGAAVWSLVFG
jgi:NADH-quinone oxidoreductase subunit H